MRENKRRIENNNRHNTHINHWVGLFMTTIFKIAMDNSMEKYK